jgi:hypothetical protein
MKPALIRLLKAILKTGLDDLQDIALDAVKYAESSGGTGEEKLEKAIAFVIAQMPSFAYGLVKTAVQQAWLIMETEGWPE